MSEEFVKDTGTGNFQRVYMTPNENIKQEDSAEKAIEEGRVQTEQDRFRDQHKIQVEDKPQEQEESLLAGKYKAAEELERAYLELQTKLGQTQPAKEEAEVTDKQIETAMENISADLFAKGMQEFQESGNLSKETVKKFVETGIPEEYLSQYIEGVRAQMELRVLQINEKLGGESHIKELVEWATNNLSEKEIEAYNVLIDSGDIDNIVTAYQSIEARMAPKQTAKFISPSKGTSNETGGFESKAEMIKAMSDPQYKKDPAFRKQVEQRLSRTRF